MISTTPAPLLLKSYDYEVTEYDFASGTLRQAGQPRNLGIGAIEIDHETHNHWWIYYPSNYHDSFYDISFDPTKSIPTQVTGAVGESIAIILMERWFNATNVQRITPHPSSKTADFKMDIQIGGHWVHTLVESKGSNASRGRPYLPAMTQGIIQLLATRLVHYAEAGFLITTSYPSRRISLIKVF